MPEVSRYHPVLVALHWFLAAFIIAALALGALAMAKTPNSDPAKVEALRAHMAGGGVILALMLLRLLLRSVTAHPPAASTGSGWLDRIAWLSHRAFYPLVFAMAPRSKERASLSARPSAAPAAHSAARKRIRAVRVLRGLTSTPPGSS